MEVKDTTYFSQKYDIGLILFWSIKQLIFKNGIRIYNQLVRKQTLNHLAQLASMNHKGQFD